MERVLSRRKFLAGLGLTTVSVALAQRAILDSKLGENSPGVDTGPGVSLASLEEILRANSSPGIGSSGNYLRSNGVRPSWVDPFTTDFDARYATIASLNRRLNVQLVDEFYAGTSESGEVGELGWTVTGTIVFTASANHPGQWSIRASTVLDNASYIQLGNSTVSWADDWDQLWIVRPVSQITNTMLKTGLTDSISTEPVGDGFFFRYNSDDADPNWMAVVAEALTGEQAFDTGIAASLNTWYVLRIVKTGSTVKFYIDDVLVNTLVDGVDATFPSGVGTAGEFSSIVKNNAAGGLNRQLNHDFFQLTQTVTR